MPQFSELDAGPVSLPLAAASAGAGTDLPAATGLAARPGASSTDLPLPSVQVSLLILATIAFFFFARSVVLPILLAAMAGTTLRPLIRTSQCFGVPPVVSAAAVLAVLAAVLGLGFFELGRPAVEWMNEAPEHMSELKRRVQRMVPGVARFSQAALAVNSLGAADPTAPTAAKPLELNASRMPSLFNWTGTFLAGVGETFVLLYLVLASGDLFLQKLVRLMPRFRDKKRAVEISHEIQQNISHYLLSVSVINILLGVLVSAGLYWLQVPNPLMWGAVVTILNFVPYFGPLVGIMLIGIVGLLTFDTLWRGLLPSAWYLGLHFLEANFFTPMLLGRRFTINPVVIFVFLIFWTWLWGVPGALLSAPILVAIKAICDRLPTLAPVSELLSR